MIQEYTMKEYDINDIDSMFQDTQDFGMDNPNDVIESAPLLIDLDEINGEAERLAYNITDKLSAYYFDEKYIERHPYIPTKIANEMNNIRRLLKMLSINEKAQDSLIANITCNASKGSLYASLTSLQNSMLNIQNQLNNLTSALEQIFSEMQAECDKTFEQKDKEVADDGSMTVRGSRDFINQLAAKMKTNSITKISPNESIDTKTGEVMTS
jgi:hypothetical protein